MDTVTNSYTLAQLATHPATSEIVFRHLKPLGLSEGRIRSVHGTLDGMRQYNMGGGIPMRILAPLMEELDGMGHPLPPHPAIAGAS